MAHTFQDAVVVISGGASGIGKSLALQLVSKNAKVCVIDRNKQAGSALVKQVRDAGQAIDFYCADMAVIEEARHVMESIAREYTRIDYVINGAGVFMGGEIRDTPLEDWHAVVSNNVFAVMNGSHFAYRQMCTQQKGYIVNIGSVAGLTPIPAMGIYGSTKYAINGFTLALRNEAKALGVRVSVVTPTIVDTPLYDTAIYHAVKIRTILRGRDKFQSADSAAARIIKGIERNKAVIHTAGSTKLIDVLYRAMPRMYDIAARRLLAKFRHTLRK